MMSGDAQDKYCEEELRPLLEEITAACIQEMPHDPKLWMRQWLIERLKARGALLSKGSPIRQVGKCADEPLGKGTSKGTGSTGEGKDAKGKGTGKGFGKTFPQQGAPATKGKSKGEFGPPPPPLGGAGKSASKGAGKPAPKVKGPTSSSEKRPGPAEAWKMIKVQSPDGHFEAEALAEGIVAAYKALRFGVIAHAKQTEIVTCLQEAHPTVATGMVLAFVQGCLPAQPTSAKTRLQMYIKYNKPACGNLFYPKAKAWFDAQDKPSDVPSVIAAFWKHWFDFTFEAVLQVRIVPEISDEIEEPGLFISASAVKKDMQTQRIGVVDGTGGKGKGKGTLKGSGRPEVGRVIDTPKPKQLKKPGCFEAWKLIEAQSEDGHFEVDAFAQALSVAYRMVRQTVSADVFSARLQALHPAVPTGMVLALADKQLPSNPTSAKNRIEMYAAEMKPACGDEFINTARNWFKSQDVPDDISSTISSLWSEWFDFEVKVDYSSKGAMDYGVRKQVQGTRISDEERQKKLEEQRKRSLEVKRAEVEKEQFWRALAPRECLDEVPWSEVMRTRWCSGGSGGATLVQVGQGEVVVLKLLGMNAVAEVMAAEVGRLAGVRVAGYSLLERDSLAMPQVLAALRSAPMEGATVDSVVRRMQIADFIMVMEFVPGTVLQGLDGQRLLTAEGASKLHAELGALIALDCLLNNVDRVPAIWMNEGNLSNVMITESGIVGIDHQVNAIGDVEGRRQYLAMLSEFCSDCAKNRVASASAIRVKNAILENTGVSLEDAALTRVLDGARTVFRHVKDSRYLLTAGLSSLEPKMKQMFGSTTADVGLASFSSISGFVAECIDMVAASEC